MSWTAVIKPISDSIQHCRFLDSRQTVLSYADVVDFWCEDTPAGTDFRAFTSGTICDFPFRAFKWETPVVDVKRLDRDFEFVVLAAPGLDRPEDSAAFAEQFSGGSESSVVAFSNLGKDAVLVVPQPSAKQGVNHCHLGSFLRTADPEQADALWQAVGHALRQRLSDIPVWLSTAGGGVAWLHVRLDDRPKYYGYLPFKER